MLYTLLEFYILFVINHQSIHVYLRKYKRKYKLKLNKTPNTL